MHSKSSGSHRWGHIFFWNSAAGAGIYTQSVRGLILDHLSCHTSYCLWRFTCAGIFAAVVHHSLCVFLRIWNCLFFSPHCTSTLPAIHCGRHRVMSEHLWSLLPWIWKDSLPLYWDKHALLLNSPVTCVVCWSEKIYFHIKSLYTEEGIHLTAKQSSSSSQGLWVAHSVNCYWCLPHSDTNVRK